MDADCIPFKDTSYFTRIILDYLEGAEELAPFYRYAPTLEAFGGAMENKNLPSAKRQLLKEAIEGQYKTSQINLGNRKAVQYNYNTLVEDNT